MGFRCFRCLLDYFRIPAFGSTCSRPASPHVNFSLWAWSRFPLPLSPFVILFYSSAGWVPPISKAPPAASVHSEGGPLFPSEFFSRRRPASPEDLLSIFLNFLIGESPFAPFFSQAFSSSASNLSFFTTAPLAGQAASQILRAPIPIMCG